MAREELDETGNENQSTMLGRLNRMFTDLFSTAGGNPNPSVTTITVATSSALAAASGTTAVFTGQGTFAASKLDTGTKIATATGGAATLAKSAGVITSEALSTAAGATYTLTLTNSTIAAADQVFASVAYGTATAGEPVVTRVTPGAGSVVIIVQNVHSANALDGTIKIAFMVLKN